MSAKVAAVRNRLPGRERVEEADSSPAVDEAMLMRMVDATV